MIGEQGLSIPGQIEAARKHGLLPPEALEGMRSIFFTLFGSPAKLDCWLTRMADELADAGNPAVRPVSLDATVIPAAFQAWMHRPLEVVDLLLERLHDFSVWGYTVKIMQTETTYTARVFDQASGHLVEEVEGPDPESLALSLKEKYGPNVEVVRE
ncbi:MAG: hypothetical protein QME75_05310 [Deltaproteobacteria bacterium]|nr:hypothetical protein [Deltaproteobacteria bacterium]